MLLIQVWRLRCYNAESMVAPAKPLYYLKRALTLEKGHCQRVV